MSHKILLDVDYRSFADFKTTFDEYCGENTAEHVETSENDDHLNEILIIARRLLDDEFKSIEEACDGIRQAIASHKALHANSLALDDDIKLGNECFFCQFPVQQIYHTRTRSFNTALNSRHLHKINCGNVKLV